jgi:hypothetical protein
VTRTGVAAGAAVRARVPAGPDAAPVRLAAAATRRAGATAVPVRVPAPLWMPFDDESVLAVACAEQVVAGRPRTSVSWATSTAGARDYAQVCLDTLVYGPGRASAAAGPRSAFNGPAAAVSICLGLRGPAQTATGGVAAGLNALVDGLAQSRAGDVDEVVVGGSTSTPVEVTGAGRSGAAAAVAMLAAAAAFARGPAAGWTVSRATRRRLSATAPALPNRPDDRPDDRAVAALAVDLLGPVGPAAGSTVLVVDDLPMAEGPPPDPPPGPVLTAGRLAVVRVRRHLGELGAAAVPAALALLACGSISSPTGVVALVVLTRARDTGTVLLHEG